MPEPASPRSPSRAQTCRTTAAALRSANAGTIRAVIGFDGFVDNLMRVVDRRRTADDFDPVRTIDGLGRKIVAAAGTSSNYELVLKEQKLGGNGPIMANALAALGARVTYVGNVGFPAVHPIFNDFARRATVYGVAEPGVTDALEFDDGKLMLNKNETLADVTWPNITGRTGDGVLAAAYADATLVGMANWTMLPHLSDVWRHLLAEVFPQLPAAAKRRLIMVDLADPAKRTTEDLADALDLLRQFQQHGDVVLGLNRNEAAQVAALRGAAAPTAEALRDTLGLHGVVVHTRHGGAAALPGVSASIDGPFVRRPKTTTGAGDHFNAGFSFGLALGLKLDECLACAVGTGGYYVTHGVSPTLAVLADFIETLPAPEPE